MGEELQAEITADKQTKNKVRFTVTSDDGEVEGVLYFPHSAIARLGKPTHGYIAVNFDEPKTK